MPLFSGKSVGEMWKQYEDIGKVGRCDEQLGFLQEVKADARAGDRNAMGFIEELAARIASIGKGI